MSGAVVLALAGLVGLVVGFLLGAVTADRLAARRRRHPRTERGALVLSAEERNEYLDRVLRAPFDAP